MEMKNMRIRYLAISLLVALVAGVLTTAFVPALADAQTLQVQANPTAIDPLDSVQIQVQVHASASSSYAVAIVVASPTEAGGLFSEGITITTDSRGNGAVTVAYPGTFTPCSTCSPPGTGGPNTILAATYDVTVSSVPAISAGTLSTTFTVRPSPDIVTGTGSIVTHATSTNTAPLSNCLPATTPPTPGVYNTLRIGSAIFTGTIATNTPGQLDTNSLQNPCVTPNVATFHAVYVLNDVTVTLADGSTITGGLTLTALGTSTGINSPTIPTSISSQITRITGTGDLRGVSGFGVISGSSVSTGAILNYWIQLQLPSR